MAGHGIGAEQSEGVGRGERGHPGIMPAVSGRRENSEPGARTGV
jgi:hypothetical protein